MRIVVTTARVNADIDWCLVRQLGIDQHRLRTVRYLTDETGQVRQAEPWSMVFTDLDTGAITDVRQRS